MNRYSGQEETICAIATPIGIGSIGVIRVSGGEAVSIVQRVFRGTAELKGFKSHTLHHGIIIDPATAQPVDEALLVIMKGPRSYTGEDVVEIQSHGNPHLLQKTLSLLIASGARLATAGEFTRRGFLAGRIDLSQAEAVMELIAAQSNAAQEMALSQLRGNLSHRIDSIRKEVLSVLTQIEASIDFIEQGIPLCSHEEIVNKVEQTVQSVEHLLATYEEGRQIREGITVVITGRSNVGKSSVMNRLLGEERAIVTPIPGTTRDTLSEWLNLSGHLILLMDTAGVRPTNDPIELEGVRRGNAALKKGEIALLVLDSSQPFTSEDMALMDRIECKKRIVVLNKSDLPLEADRMSFHTRYPSDPIIYCSAKTGEGFSELKNEIVTLLFAPRGTTPKTSPVAGEPERPLVALLRHKHALDRASHALKRGLQSAKENASVEFIAADLRYGLDALGEIVGETTTDEILDQIFNQFCIGK